MRGGARRADRVVGERRGYSPKRHHPLTRFHNASSSAYSGEVRLRKWYVLGLALAVTPLAQELSVRPPRFDAYPVKELWSGTLPNLKLTTRSERMFRTNLTNAAKEPPNFRDTACFEGTNDEFHVDSRLMIVRCGQHYSARL